MTQRPSSDDEKSNPDPPSSPLEQPTLPPLPAERHVEPGDTQAGFAPGSEAGAISKIIGDYEILEEIARGGMGVVYKARQRSLNRIVALKMILSGRFASPQDLTRFFTEAEAAARLDHPGIVPVYEINQAEGQYFFSMKYVDGGSLATHMQSLRGDPRAAIALLAKVARAVHHAHQRGILHRDLKPANILLDSQGQPLVSDLGLAKQIESGSNLTQTGAIMGTPAYMPPEQATGRREVTTAADIYALGAIMYELLTGHPPFQAATPLDTLLLVIEHNLRPAREVNSQIDRELDLVCRKCLEAEADARYQSAAALADDLENWLDGRPVSVTPPSIRSMTARWIRTHLRSAVGAAAIGAVSGVVLGVLFLIPSMAGLTRSMDLVYADFPQDRPAITHWLAWMSSVPQIVRNTLPFIVVSVLAVIGILNALVLRPASREAAVAAALISALFIALLTFVISSGWSPVVETSVQAGEQDIRLLASAMWSDGDADRELAKRAMLRRYPELAKVPHNERGARVSDKVIADQVSGIPLGLWGGLFGTAILVMVPIVVCTVWASMMLKQHDDVGLVLGHYFEIAPMFTAAFFLMIAFLFGLMESPGWFAQLGLYAAAAGAIATGLYDRKWYWRATMHVLWWIFVLLMIREVGRAAQANQVAMRLVPEQRYQQAATYFDRFLQRHPTDNSRFKVAILCLYMGDEDRYREHCRLLLSSYPSDIYAPQSADRIAKACLLRPDLQGDRLTAIHELAQTASEFDKQSERHWFFMCRALWEFEQGHLDDADLWCRKTLDGAANVWLVATTKLILSYCVNANDPMDAVRRSQYREEAESLASTRSSPKDFEADWENRLFYEILSARLSSPRMIPTAPSS